MKEYFKLPNMSISREDLEDNFDNNFNNISDENMERIAYKLSELLMQDWDICLNAVKEGYPELFEVNKK